MCVFFPQTNDFVRDVFRDKDGFISLPFEIVAGGCVSKQVFFFGEKLRPHMIVLQ